MEHRNKQIDALNKILIALAPEYKNDPSVLAVAVQNARKNILEYNQNNPIKALNLLMACFDDELEIKEQYQDQLSSAWEYAEKIINGGE